MSIKDKVEEKKEEVKKLISEIDPYNQSIMQLANDISIAINGYMKRGYVNLAALMGVLEDMKINVSEIARRKLPADRVKFTKETPNYIGW